MGTAPRPAVTPRRKLEKAGRQAQEAGELPGRGQAARGRRTELAEAAEAYLEGQEFWAAAATFEKMGKGERPPSCSCRRATTRRRPSSSSARASPRRRRALPGEGQQPRGGAAVRSGRPVGQGGRALREERLPAAGGRGLREEGRVREGGRGLREALHGERLLRHHATPRPRPSADQKSALLAGRLYEKAGDLKRALQVYSEGQLLQGGGGGPREARPVREGGRAVHARGGPRRAPPAPSRRRATWSRPRTCAARWRFKADQPAEAAAFFVQGPRLPARGRALRVRGDAGRGRRAYEAGDSWAAAGARLHPRRPQGPGRRHLRARGGEFETAAKLYEEAGNDRKAIELYGKAGLTFKSGEAAAKAGDREHAIALLQRVGPERRELPRRHRAAGPALHRGGAAGPGRRAACRRRSPGQPVSAANLDLYYWLAVAQEASGKAAEALAIYEKIQAEDLQFRDVDQRVAAGRLRASRAVADLPPARRRRGARARRPRGPPLRPPPRRRRRSGAAAAARARRASRPKEEVGRGPLGAVFRAEDEADGRNVALRVLPPGAPEGRGVLPALVADLKAAARALPPEPGQGPRPGRGRGPALPGDRVRRGQELRGGAQAPAAA